MVWNLQFINPDDWLKILLLMSFGSIAMIIKTEGATSRWHFSINFLVYSFSMLNVGTIGTMLVILVSNLAYWIWYRKEYIGTWFIIIFNIASFILVTQITMLVYQTINPIGSLESWISILAILASMLVFTFLNHLIVGIVVWLARGENFTQSGVFELMALLIDFTILVMGAGLNIIWSYNPTAILLFLLPLYLISNTLRVPSLERQTEIDQKTGLYNHGHFIGQFEHELARANRFERPLTVILGDLDLLRNINNTYGHLAGDEVLKGIAKILKESVREYDIVARFGGEEFAILMPETDSQTAFQRAESIRNTIALSEFTVPTSVDPIRATMSFGVASRINSEQTKEEIIHNADVVLYRAKLNGRNRTQIFQNDDSDLIEGDLEGALKLQILEDQLNRNKEILYAAASTQYHRPPPKTIEQDADTPIEQDTNPEETKNIAKVANRRDAESNTSRVNLFIATVVLISMIFFSVLYQPIKLNQIWGLLVFATFVALTEWFSIDIYVRDTAVSTSAAPILAGVLLFGSVGSLVLSLVFAVTAYLKFRGPMNRILFNTANQLLPAMIYLGFIQWFSTPYLTWTLELQLLFCLLAAMITYISTTALISIGMHLRNQEGLLLIWKNQFSWLFPYYIVMGLLGYALVFGFQNAGYIGLILIITPLMMLRFGQEQFIGRTKKIVLELRDKNLRLQKKSQEITEINNGLLETLAEVIDLRDEYVLNHSRSVTQLATQISKEAKLPSRQIEIIRQASLLHDIGKLGIPDEILRKPASLTEDEYAIIKKHPKIGANLIEKSVALKNLVPIVQYHHERFDGTGYPEGLKGYQIPLEARIVAIADAIEAMASQRPYHKIRNWAEIIVELEEGAGSQFDPEIALIAIELLRTKIY